MNPGTQAAVEMQPSGQIQPSEGTSMLVTVRVDKQLFGIPVQQVREVLKECKVAHIPLVPPQIAGAINLRGRIVTVIDMHRHLGIESKENASCMFVVVEHRGEYYSLKADSVGEVLTISNKQIEKTLTNLSPRWKEIAIGIHRLKQELLVIINIDAFFMLLAKGILHAQLPDRR